MEVFVVKKEETMFFSKMERKITIFLHFSFSKKMMHNLFCWVKFVLLSLLLNIVLDDENKILTKAQGGVDKNNSIDAETAALCNVNLMNFLPSPYQELSGATCSPVWRRFTFRFFQNEKNITTIVISGKYDEGKGWIGIGFPKDGSTVNSSTMIGFMDKHKIPTAKMYFIDANNHSLLLPDVSNFLLTEVPPLVVIKKKQLYLAFQLTFRTRMYHKTVIFAQGNASPVGNQLTMHENARTMIVEFDTAVRAKSTGIRRLMSGHGYLGILAFGLIIPVGSIVARYFKHLDPIWYHIHYTIQYIGYVFAILALAAGRLLYDHLGHPVPKHRIIGFTLVMLTTLQVLAFVLRPHKESKFQRIYHCYHVWLGRLVLVLGTVNIIMGMKLGHSKLSLRIGYSVLVTALLIAVIFFEIRKWKRARVPLVVVNADNDLHADADEKKITMSPTKPKMERCREDEQ